MKDVAELGSQVEAPSVNGSGPTRASRAWGRRPRTEKPAVYRKNHFTMIIGFLVLVGLVAPMLANTRVSNNLVNLWIVYSIAGIGFYWIFGLAGRFAFCQTFMMALGAYTSAWIVRSGDGNPIWLGLVGALIVTALLAALVGLAVHRASDLYFAIATLAVTQVGVVVFRQWEGFSGPSGTVVAIEPLTWFGKQLIDDTQVFWFFLGALGVTLVLAALIERSPLRRFAIAARDRTMVARTVGVPTMRVQLVMFAIGSAFGGLSGALIGHWGGLISVDSFGITLSIGLFLMLILGGAGSYWGPVIGAAFYVWMPEVLTGFDSWKQVIYGGLLLVTIIVLPEGIIGLFQRARDLVLGRKHDVETVPGPIERIRSQILQQEATDDPES